jgi:signal transduction histidine kinase
MNRVFNTGGYHMNATTKFENYFHVFRDIIRAMHSSTSLKEVLNIVVTKSADVLDAKGALLRILNKETNQFDVGAAWGLGERYLSKGPVTTEKLLSGQTELHQVKIISDIWQAPRVEYPQAAWNEGIRMMIDVPLAVKEQMVGLIRIYLTEQRSFTDDELDFVITVAEQCACIIQRVQLMENQQARFDHLATQMDKMSALGRMAAGIAHEINNPLTGILLYSSNMRKKVSPESNLDEGLNIIINETQRCKTIIQGLLEFARDKEPQMILANVNDIVERALGIVDNEFRLRHVNKNVHLAGGMIKTMLDENQIEQVIINLLLNALHAVEGNGIVTIKSEVDSSRENVRVEISDNGCGVAAADIKKIFEPFYSTKNKGTGLGLAVSYGIVQNHEGDIQVFSIPGKITRFTVELPVRTQNFNAKADHENAQHPGH